jgi:MATE family multidrug resistance protein
MTTNGQTAGLVLEQTNQPTDNNTSSINNNNDQDLDQLFEEESVTTTDGTQNGNDREVHYLDGEGTLYIIQCNWCSRTWRNNKEELYTILSLSWPTVLSYLLTFLPSFVNLIFIGHVGTGEHPLELPAAALAITFVNVTGVSFGIGLLTGVETLCAQAYGAKNYRRVGVVVQRGILICTTFCVPCILLWFLTEDVFLLFRQNPELAKLSGRYTRLLAPGLWFLLAFETLKRWLQTMSLMRPIIYVSICSVIINAVGQYTLVIFFGFGFNGSPLALMITWMLLPVLLLSYIVWTKTYVQTWHGWTRECLSGWGEYLKLALPGSLMLCAEWWGFEITIIAVGWLGEVELAAHTIGFNTLGWCYMAPLGLGVAANTRVGNLLGAGKPSLAKRSAHIVLVLVFACQFTAAAALFLLRNIWGSLYSTDQSVVELTSHVLLYGALLTIFDGFSGTSSGVLRGAAKQMVGAVLNLIAYYVLALPVGLSLAFLTPLRLYGVWFGLLFGVSVVSFSFLVVILRTDWEKASKEAQARSAVEGKDVGIELKNFAKDGNEEQEDLEALSSESKSNGRLNGEYVEGQLPAYQPLRVDTMVDNESEHPFAEAAEATNREQENNGQELEKLSEDSVTEGLNGDVESKAVS